MLICRARNLGTSFVPVENYDHDDEIVFSRIAILTYFKGK